VNPYNRLKSHPCGSRIRAFADWNKERQVEGQASDAQKPATVGRDPEPWGERRAYRVRLDGADHLLRKDHPRRLLVELAILRASGPSNRPGRSLAI
jgi:hypothetical protein